MYRYVLIFLCHCIILTIGALKLSACCIEVGPSFIVLLFWSFFDFSGHSCSILQSHLSSAFKFLHWKLRHHAVSFTTVDSHIVLSNDFRRFTELSSDCCSYTKHIINCYVEFKWQSRVDNQWLLNAYSMAPIVSCEILSFDSFVNRKTETLCLSFFYPNNLLNSF